MSDRRSPNLFELVGLGTFSAVCVVAGMGAGYAIGNSTGIGPSLAFAGLAIGIVTAVAVTYFKIKRYL